MSIKGRLKALLSPSIYYYTPNTANTINVDGFDIAHLYETQPNLQSVVTFLADNIAQLPLKIFDRVSDTERVRQVTTPAAILLKHPNDDMTAYELIRTTCSDIYLYGRCVWLLLEDPDMASGYQLRPIPNEWIIGNKDGNAFNSGNLLVSSFGTEGVIEIPQSQLVIFTNYDPSSPRGFVSPVESLRQTLLEQMEADEYRRDIWKNGGRMSAYISRPANIQPWSPEQAERFKKGFQAGWAKGGGKAGSMPVLEDGMEIKSAAFNAKEAQWAESKTLSREEVAGLYHVNPSLIWHTGGQTYASAKDNSRALYADTLAPMLRQLQDRINEFLLPKLGESPTVYVEFDIQAKLQGSFEEQAQVIQSSVGAPWLTRNEARAKNNLPPIEGGDELIVPLNVLEGGLASPTDTTRTGDTYNDHVNANNDVQVKSQEEKNEPRVHIKGAPEQDTIDTIKGVYTAFFKRQAKAVIPKIGAAKSKETAWWNSERWVTELADDLFKVAKEISYQRALDTLEKIGADTSLYDFARTENYLKAMCESRSKTANKKTYEALVTALEQDISPQEVFDEAQETRAEKCSTSMAAGLYAFSSLESLRQAEDSGFDIANCTKMWVTTSSNPRDSHKRMNGETVLYNERFSNGADFPQDRAIEAAESCNCRCVVDIYIP